MLSVIKTGIIYKNPSPHLKSIHAYFPSVVVAGNGDMLATVVLGEAFESVNMHTWLFRSTDSGETWRKEYLIHQADEESLISDYSRISVLPNGELIILMMLADRSGHPEEGLTNPDTLGFVPVKFVIFRSKDHGFTWKGPDEIRSPLGNVPLELCSPVTPVNGNKCFIPTSIWRYWDGSLPTGFKMVALVSHDLGRTWPEYVNVMVDPNQEIQYWESKIIEITDNRLLAVAWAYDPIRNKDLPNQFAISHDDGKSWSLPKSTGLLGQTLTPFLLDDGRILSVYRRMDKPGLWANISGMANDQWINESRYPLWGQDAGGLTGEGDNMAQNFNLLKFGAPCITKLPDRTVFIAFWCVENCVSVIRWFKVKIR